MRLHSFEATRFGNHENRSLRFAGGARVHVIAGANEAGKSTLWRALLTFFYGFGAQTLDDHTFGAASLSVRAELQIGAGAREMLTRRKGRGATLARADGTTVANDAWAQMLGGTSKEAFLQLYCLDHAQLRHGGLAILNGEGDGGSHLVAAAVGGLRLDALRKQLEAEASAIYTVRSDKRLLRTALTEVKRCDEALRATEAESGVYAARIAHLRDLEPQRLALQREREQLRATRARLETRRHLHLIGANLQRVETELRELGAGPSAEPGDEAAVAKWESESARWQTESAAQLEQAQLLDERERSAPPADPITLLQARIAALEIEAVRTAERATEEAAIDVQLQRELSEVGIAEPSANAQLDEARTAELHALRSLAERLQSTTAEMQKLDEQRVADAAEHVLCMQQAAASTTQATRIAPLLATFERAAAACRAAQAPQTGAEFAQAADRHFAGISLEKMRELATPPMANLRANAAQARELLAELQLHAERTHQHEKQRQTLGAAEQLQFAQPTPDGLARVVDGRAVALARVARDALLEAANSDWSKLEDAERATSLDQLRDAVQVADALVDAYARDCERAAAAAARDSQRLAAGARAQELTLAGQLLAAKLAQLQTELERALPREVAQLLAARELGDPASWVQFAATAMEPRAQALCELQALAARAEAQRARVTELDAHVHACAAALRSALAELGQDASQAAAAVLEASSLAYLARLQQTAAVALGRAQDAQLRSERAAATHTQLRASKAADRAAMRTVLMALERDPNWAPEVAEPYARAALAARQGLQRIGSLRARKAELLQAREHFWAELRAVAHAAAEPPAEPAAALAQLSERLRAATKAHAERIELARSRATCTQNAEQLATRAAELRQLRAPLVARYGDVLGANLASAVQAARRRQLLEQQLEQLRAQHQAAAGAGSTHASVDQVEERGASIMPAEALQFELEALDASAERLDAQISTLDAELGREWSAKAAQELASDAGAEHARGRESKLAEATQLAAQWLRASLAEAVLAREIADQRERLLGPMLRAASQVFAELTDGQYTQLLPHAASEAARSSAASRDALGAIPALFAERRDGTMVAPANLSEGTRDQLYLALRLGVHMVLSADRPAPLPMILDDTFVHFDDQRTGAALRALAQMPAGFQVLYFTHHESVARAAAAASPELGIELLRIS